MNSAARRSENISQERGARDKTQLGYTQLEERRRGWESRCEENERDEDTERMAVHSQLPTSPPFFPPTRGRGGRNALFLFVTPARHFARENGVASVNYVSGPRSLNANHPLSVLPAVDDNDDKVMSSSRGLGNAIYTFRDFLVIVACS